MSTDYILYQSQSIVDNQWTLIDDIRVAHENFKKLFAEIPDVDSTAFYKHYNIFALTSPSAAFYKVYTEIRNLIITQTGDSEPLWFQAWLNHQDQDSVLDWHQHDFDFHGYISIDPKNTRTVFENYVIENKVGQIYFGPGYRKHKVEVVEPFQGVRTTIGFDVFRYPSSKFVTYTEKPFINLGMMPLL